MKKIISSSIISGIHWQSIPIWTRLEPTPNDTCRERKLLLRPPQTVNYAKTRVERMCDRITIKNVLNIIITNPPSTPSTPDPAQFPSWLTLVDGKAILSQCVGGWRCFLDQTLVNNKYEKHYHLIRPKYGDYGLPSPIRSWGWWSLWLPP